ncbi:MAG TPA: Gldg family protein, partial [Anaerolineales bacterium]|nr:Gldg family protein [Anaerolineales bacterium]
MNNKNKQSDEQGRNTWAPIVALIISALACVAAFLLAITRGLVAMKVFTVSNVDILRNWLFVSVALVVLGLAVYTILEPDRVRRFFTGRQARYGSNALIMTLAFLGILVVGNVLAYQYPRTLLDLTEDKTNTLSPEMTKALGTLPQKVTATGFFSQNSSTDSAEKLLSNIKANSKGKFDYKFVNPDRDPQAAKNAGITGDGKILLQMGDHKEIVAFASETEILKGFLRLLNPGSHVVYFLTGHGEHDIEQASDTSMTSAKSALENKNYTVKTLNLLAENQIPEDANVVVIAGPMKPVSADEVKLLKGYLDKGGSLIVMEDPTALTKFGDAGDPLADMLAKDWGIVFNNDIVIDLDSPQPTTAVSAMYDGSHAITRNMNNLATYYPYTRSLKVGTPVEGVTLNQLVQTNTRSWGETDFKSLTEGGNPVGLDPATETQGPLTLAISGENTATRGRVVAFGTSNLAIDQLFGAYGNGDMFVNSVDWAAEQPELGNIAPKTPTERTMKAPGQFQWIAILLGSIFIIPGLVVLAGVSTWLA